MGVIGTRLSVYMYTAHILHEENIGRFASPGFKDISAT